MRVEKLEPKYISRRNVKWPTHFWKYSWQNILLKMLEIKLTDGSIILLLRVCTKINENTCSQKSLLTNVHSTLTIMSINEDSLNVYKLIRG